MSDLEKELAINLAGYTAEALYDGHADSWATFAGLSSTAVDVIQARIHARAALEERGHPANAEAVEATCEAVWCGLKNWLARPAVWNALLRVQQFAIRRHESGAADVLSPSEDATLDAIVASLTPHQITSPRKIPDTQLTENGTIIRAKEHRMNIASRLHSLGVHASRVEQLSADVARKRDGGRGIVAAFESAGPGSIGVLAWPETEHEQHERLFSTSHRSARPAHTSPARRSAPTSARSDERFAALAGVDVATFRQHQAELLSADDEEREAAHDDASQSDARRAERLCAASVGLDVSEFRRACNHVGSLVPIQGGAIGLSNEQLAGIPINAKKGGNAPSDDDGDEGDQGSNGDDGDEDGADDKHMEESMRLALKIARQYGYKGDSAEFRAEHAKLMKNG